MMHIRLKKEEPRKFHIRLAIEGEPSEAAVAVGSRSEIIKAVHSLGAGISEMAEGEKKELIRVTLGQERIILLKPEWEVQNA